MKNRTPNSAWKTAREDAHLSQTDVFKAFARSELHEVFWVDQAKLSRFERGAPAVIDPVAKLFMARVYGVDLETIDPAAHHALKSMMAEVGSDLGELPSSCNDDSAGNDFAFAAAA